MPDLLIELFSEEIPARAQPAARRALKKLVTDGVINAGLSFSSAGAFSTPRRLVLTIEGLRAESRERREERRGPRADAPDKAIDGFLRATGLTRDQLERRPDAKGDVYYATIIHPGRKAAAIVAEVVEHAIRNFPWPRSMRWGSGSLRWIRPLHSVLCILTSDLGAEIVPVEVDGIRAGNTTHGHRFMAPDAFAVTSFEDYQTALRRARVMLDPEERASHIRQQAHNLAFAAGLEVVDDAALLDEVAGLVEWPVPLLGRIPEEFLDLPPEVLQTSMKEHQKFFSVRDGKEGAITGFLTVANVETPDDGALILRGNLRVLAARLSDARFFWENDLREARAGMKNWAEGLKSVTFHNKLGSQADRIDRIAALARELAPAVGADPDEAERAAKVSKLDLRSEMVGEFPELQGVMGRYYALAAGEPESVADAVRDHWSPKGEKDLVPAEPVSVAVALADKLDTLVGFWTIDERPTGSKDPFALRRAALGLIRITLCRDFRIRLNNAIRGHYYIIIKQFHAYNRIFSIAWETWEDRGNNKNTAEIAFELLHPNSEPTAVNNLTEAYLGPFLGDSRDVIYSSADYPDEFLKLKAEDEFLNNLLTFLHERLKVHLRDEGIRHDIIDACLAMPGNDDLMLLVRRARALDVMLKTEDGANLIQGFRRANNILAQAEEEDGTRYTANPDPALAETDEERALFAALDHAEAVIVPAMGAEDFTTAMGAMAALRAPIDAFFEAVQVNAPTPELRRNRLCLLARVRDVCAGVADLTRIEG